MSAQMSITQDKAQELSPNLSIATDGSDVGIFRFPQVSSLMGCLCSLIDR